MQTILWVEDEAVVRAMVSDALVERGYRVLEAGGGAEALEVARRHSGPIHLAVSDVVIPEPAGPELADQIAAVHPEARFLFVSGYAGSRLDTEALARSGAGFLRKPFRTSALIEKVEEILRFAAR
jgi:two-component system cell cycle sensor histidine kinase/response regulator CckA